MVLPNSEFSTCRFGLAHLPLLARETIALHIRHGSDLGHCHFNAKIWVRVYLVIM
jgi:hypothetical protein